MNDDKIKTDRIVDESDNDADGESVMITDEVLAIMAGVAAAEVKSVHKMSGGFAGGLVEAFGRRNLSKGVKVVTRDDKTIIDLYVIIKYGYRIPEAAWEIQENVKKTIEELTGMVIDAVNIHVQGVNFGDFDEKEDKSESGDNNEQ